MLGEGAVDRFRADLERVCGPTVDRLLVAVSGGADSLALLLLAQAALPGRVEAATVDHGLRAEGAGEAVFVAETCRALGVPHAILSGALPERVGRSANLSARARELRYRLLEEHRLATGCSPLATAHHADDQAETLAMRLNRGAGVAGLAGIRSTSGHVVRPLLDWRRADLAALVAAAGYVPIHDPSNVDDRFDRARMRKSLSGASWIDARRWGRSASAMADAEDALAWFARRLAEERIGSDGGQVTLTIIDEPAEIVRRLVADCLRRVDPRAEPRADEVVRLAERLRAGVETLRPSRSTLAGVVVTARTEGRCVVARFGVAPPRRAAAR